MSGRYNTVGSTALPELAMNHSLLSENYRCRILPHVPDRKTAIRFSRTEAYHGSFGLIVEVETPDGGWIGDFERGPVGLTAVRTAPSADVIFIAARGLAYFVNVSDPSQCDVVPMVPIIHAVDAPALGLLILSSFTHLLAYDIDGERWQSERVSVDGIQIQHVDDQSLSGVAWDPSQGGRVEFRLDLATGEVEGGVYKKLR